MLVFGVWRKVRRPQRLTLAGTRSRIAYEANVANVDELRKMKDCVCSPSDVFGQRVFFAHLKKLLLFQSLL